MNSSCNTDEFIADYSQPKILQHYKRSEGGRNYGFTELRKIGFAVLRQENRQQTTDNGQRSGRKPSCGLVVL